MNFLKRAFLVVTRKKGRTLILFVIFAAIANLVLTGFAIQHATNYASVLARQKLGGKLTLTYDMQKAMQNARAAMAQEGAGSSNTARQRIQRLPITEEMAQKIAGLNHIIDYNYTVNGFGIADGFSPVVTEEQDGQNNDQTSNLERRIGNLFGGGDNGTTVMPDVTVIGVSSTELTDAFNNGNAKLIDGKHITMEDGASRIAVIEKNLAESNNLKIGDKVRIKPQGAEESVEFTIVGIYEAGSTASAEGGRMGNLAFTQPYNRIYVDYKSAFVFKTSLSQNGSASSGLDSAVFYVDDPQNIDKVKAAAQALDIDWNSFTLDADDAAYKQMMGPIENVASFSMTVVYLVAIAGAVILALILMLSVKERMYETGVLLSMGESKVKIIMQYIAEVLIISIVAFGISAFSGGFIARGIGNKMLEREIKVAQEQGIGMTRDARAFGQASGNGQFARLLNRRFQVGANGEIKPIDSMDIKITASEIGQMSAAGLLIIIAGTILPASMIMRFRPKAILTKAT